MGKSLKLKGTEDTPEVNLDSEANQFVISGRSLPEDAVEFYRPVISWVKAYVQSPNPDTEFQIKLQYFNSSSVKQVSDLLVTLEGIIKAGKKVKVTWLYEEGDELMEIKGQEFKSVLSIPFELKTYAP